MLKKIILLNSAKYQKAIITFDRDSIQISGNNNAGKTSLISVLNFLYLPSKKDWNFDHEPTKTLNYYFGKLDKNYIIFEIFTNSYFCILIKRDENNALAYYKIQAPYDEIQGNFFQEKADGSQALLGFKDIEFAIIDKIEKLDKKKFTEVLYGKSKKDKTVLWLQNNVTQKSFSKIYKYLLNTKLITNEAVKDSLLVADNKDNISREFTHNDSQAIEDIKQHQKEIQTLEKIKQDYNNFKEIVAKYKVKKSKIDINYQVFYNLYNQEAKENNDTLKTIGNEIIELSAEITKNTDKKTTVARELGRLEEVLRVTTKSCNTSNDEIAKIEQYRPESILRDSLTNLKKQFGDLNYALSQIKNEDYTAEKINDLILKEEQKIQRLKGNINNFDNLLVHHIAEDVETKKIIASILNDEVLDLDKSNIIQSIQNSSSEIVEIFDGKIDISNIRRQEEFTTIKVLQDQLSDASEQLDKYKTIQGNIKDLLKKREDLDRLKRDIDDIDSQIIEIDNLSTLKQQLDKLKEEKESLEGKDGKGGRVQELKDGNDKINDELDKINTKKDKKEKIQGQCKDKDSALKVYCAQFEDEIKGLQVEEKTHDKSINIDALVTQIKKSKKSISILKTTKDSKFTILKEALEVDYADEVKFIEVIGKKIINIKDKKADVKDIVKMIATNVSEPTKIFIEQLEQFKKYITSLNTKFKKYQISNLSQIEIKIESNQDLEQDLKHISEIKVDDLLTCTEEHDKKMQILSKYIEEDKFFKLSDLFDIKFKINDKDVDLGRQTESNGTDRMLKVILFILLMKALVIQDKDNKLIIYIDELGEVDDNNIAQLIKICKENNFIPIFASPDKKPHIDKYYDLLETRGNEKIVVDDNRAIYANRN